MATKKQKAAAIKQLEPSYHIEGCNFIAQAAPANEHTRDAIVALAQALQANANAIAEAARALKGGNATMETGLRVGS